jgi:hypothetical protein
MALVTNNISGSSADSWKIGITGSVIFANPGAGTFPDLPGADTSFFVSGSRGGKGTSGVAVIGGDAVVSGSLTIGTGSITITSNEIQFLGGVARITSGANGLTLFDSAYPSGKSLTDLVAGGGGGGGDAVFTAANSSEAYTTSSIAIGTAATADANGADVFFFVSGSNAGGASNKVSLFGGPVIASGSFVRIVATDGSTAVDLTRGGAISGSSNLQAGGNLTIAGTSNLVGDVTLSGGITVGGNVIKSSTGATAITLSGDSVIIPGDLTVQGTTLTVDATTVSIEDPVIGLGFTSGSATRGAPGDRGFIGGLDGENNVAMIWDETADGFGVFRTTSSTTSSLPVDVVDYSTFRAGKFELGGGTSAYVTSSIGTNLTVYADGVTEIRANTSKVVLSGAAGFGTSFEIAGTQFAELKDSSTNTQFGATGGKQLTVSGSTLTLTTGGSVNVQQNSTRIGQFIGNAGSNFKVAAQNGSGNPTSLVLTGSSLDLGANSSGINLNFADNPRGSFTYSAAASALSFGSSGGIALSLSASNGMSIIHGTPGVGFSREFGLPSYLIIEGDGPNDARLRATADINLRADGGDIKFTSGSSTPLTVTVAGNNANIQGANNQQVAIGAVGATGVMNVSGSTVGINFGTGGLKLYRDWSDALQINVAGGTTFISGTLNQNVRLAAGTGTGALSLSGSTIAANAGTGGFIFQKDGAPELHINAADTTTTISGSANQSVTLAAGTGATTAEVSGSIVKLTGGTSVDFFKDATKIAFVGASPTSGLVGLHPNTDVTYNLGSPQLRWANIYTGDLHLRNDRGDWTIIEERDYLSITNNYNGKRYKFVLEEI